MRQIDSFTTLLAILLVVIQIALAIFGEKRVTVYIVATVLIYYILYSLFSLEHLSKRHMVLLNIVLIVLFTVSILYKILNIILMH